MPESPEVKLLTETIRQHLIGHQIVGAQIINGKYLTKQKVPNWELFTSNLPLTILEIGSHGKFIYFRLDRGLSIGIGLGMVGTFNFMVSDKQNKIRLQLDNGQTLCYDDYRNFGNWVVFANQTELDAKLRKLGPNILSDQPLDLQTVQAIYSRYNGQNICKVIMAQDIISGIGVYIKSEALYREKVNPMATLGSLGLEKFLSILQTARQFAIESYNLQRDSGISYRGYAVSSGDKDYMPISKSKTLFLVYEQKYDPNGFLVQKIKTPDGRNTSYVPQIQIEGAVSSSVNVACPPVVFPIPITIVKPVMVNNDEIISDELIDEVIEEPIIPANLVIGNQDEIIE